VRNCAAEQSRPFNTAQALQDAANLHRQGRLREVEKLYARVLKAAPDNFDALHLLGLVTAQSGQMGTEPASVPADIPYLRADDARIAKWRSAIETPPGKRVALAWAGNPSHPNDRIRSLDLKLLAPLLALEGTSFVSVQRELRAGDEELSARHPQVKHVGSV
jgi:thioredoxin-like negative regulator of GroEL